MNRATPQNHLEVGRNNKTWRANNWQRKTSHKWNTRMERDYRELRRISQMTRQGPRRSDSARVKQQKHQRLVDSNYRPEGPFYPKEEEAWITPKKPLTPGYPSLRRGGPEENLSTMLNWIETNRWDISKVLLSVIDTVTHMNAFEAGVANHEGDLLSYGTISEWGSQGFMHDAEDFAAQRYH